MCLTKVSGALGGLSPESACGFIRSSTVLRAPPNCSSASKKTSRHAKCHHHDTGGYHCYHLIIVTMKAKLNIKYSEDALKPCCCCPFHAVSCLLCRSACAQPEPSEVPCHGHARLRAPGVDATRPSVDCNVAYMSAARRCICLVEIQRSRYLVCPVRRELGNPSTLGPTSDRQVPVFGPALPAGSLGTEP